MPDFTSTQSEFAINEDAAAYDAWFRAKVEKSLTSTGLHIPRDEVMTKMHAIIDRHRSQ